MDLECGLVTARRIARQSRRTRLSKIRRGGQGPEEGLWRPSRGRQHHPADPRLAFPDQLIEIKVIAKAQSTDCASVIWPLRHSVMGTWRRFKRLCDAARYSISCCANRVDFAASSEAWA
jgi:hypothetical protein